MKVLSKYFKVVLCFVAFALCSFMFAFAPTFTALEVSAAAIDGYNVAINAIKMPTSEVDYNTPGKDVFKVPLLKSVMGSASTSYKIRVIDPAGFAHDYDVATASSVRTEDENLFGAVVENNLIVNAKNEGQYKIVYIVTQGNRTYYSNSYTVSVKNVSYALDFTTPIAHETEKNEDGTDKIIGYTKNGLPAKMAISNNQVELPVAYAKIVDKDLTVVDGVVTNKVASIKVTKNSAPQTLNGDGSIFTSKDGKYYITPSEAGVYVVEYSFSDSANRPTKSFRIEVEEGYKMADLKLAAQPTMPSVELGKTGVTLPKISVNAGDEKNVDINVDSIVIEKDSDSNIKQTLNNNTFKFDMTPEAFEGVNNYNDMIGNYRVTYNVSYNGKSLSETFYINGVTVSSKPSIKLSYNYDIKNGENYKSVKEIKEAVKLNAETELKAEYLSSSEMLMPAVYVEDAVTTKFSDFVVERVLRKGSNYYYIDNAKYDEDANDGKGGLVPVTSEDAGYNASGDTNIGQFNKAVKFKFSDKADNIEGTYYLEYRVYTNSVKDRNNILTMSGTTDKYTFKVVSTHSETVPTISITNLKNKTVKNTEEITVNVKSSDELDSRIKNVVYTYSSKKAEATESFEYYLTKAIDTVQTAAGYEKKINILEDENVKTEMLKYFNDFALVEEVENSKDNFKLDLSEKSGDVHVVAATINDDGSIASDEKVLTIKDISSDNTEPALTILQSELDNVWKDGTDIKEFQIAQGKEVVLPTVWVADADKTLIPNVSYYVISDENSKIEYRTPIDYDYYYDTTITSEEVQVIKGGKIVTNEAGVYYVSYTATDAAGNTSVMYFTFEVVDSSKPVLSVEPVGEDITITGNTVSAKKGAVIDFETTLKSADGKQDLTSNESVSIKVSTEGKALSYAPSGDGRYSYRFNDYGTYVVTISGKTTINIGGVDEVIKAETKTIKIVIAKEDIKWLGEFDIPEYGIQNQDFEIKDVAASNGAEVEVTYLTPSTAEKDAKKAVKKTDANGYIYWVIPAEDTKAKGTYTIIYTATNSEDKLVQKKEVKFGDNVAPTLTYEADEITNNIVYSGEDIEVVVKQDNSKKEFIVKAYNNGKELYSEDIKLNIKDTTDNGDVTSSVSWSRLSFELTGSNVTPGEESTSGGVTTKQYFIKGTGSYSLKLTAEDSYKNSKTETIDFKVVAKAEKAKTNKDTVVGATLIIVSLVLLAGVILFFTFAGKKSSKSKKSTMKIAKKSKSAKKVESDVKIGEIDEE